MRPNVERGFSLPELIVAMTLICTLLALSLPRAQSWLDRAAVNRAAGDITMAIAIARHQAIAWGADTRLVVDAAILATDTLGAGWGTWREVPGPAAHGVTLAISNRRITFAPNGIAQGFSNTRIVLSRGSHSETITVSRVGRVKRW
jgi:prepilin-type N-terminal cleavage/methylation domain-containing protein